MNEEKKPIYCLANKEIIENHETRIVALEEGGSGGSYSAGDGIVISENVISASIGSGLAFENGAIKNAAPNVQADYNETDISSPAFIRNKPLSLPNIQGKNNFHLKVNSNGDNVEWISIGKTAYISDIGNEITLAELLDLLSQLPIYDKVTFRNFGFLMSASGIVDTDFVVHGSLDKITSGFFTGSVYLRDTSNTIRESAVYMALDLDNASINFRTVYSNNTTKPYRVVAVNSSQGGTMRITEFR